MNNTERYNSIDLLKFLLAIVIVFHHFQQLTDTRFEIVNFYGGRICFGYIVELFFIISGFLATISIKATSRLSLFSYFKKKASRLYPMGILSIIAYTVILLIYKAINGIYFNEWGFTSGVSVWRFVTSITLISDGGAIRDVDFSLNNPIWYICVLLICYVALWMIIRFSNLIKVRVEYFLVAACLIGIGCLQYNINLPFFNTISARGYSSFFWGMVLYFIYKRWNGKWLTIGSLILLLILISLYMIDFEMFYQNQRFEFTYVVFPAVLFSFLSINSLMTGKIWEKLGGVSFGIYLWHCPGLLLFCMLRERTLLFQDIKISSMLIFTAIIIGWSFFSYFCIELPINKLFSKTKTSN